jgi:hypothetical protein
MFSTVTEGKDGVSGGVTFTGLSAEEHYQWLKNMGLSPTICGHTIAWCACSRVLACLRA